jgi:hypothetical protein
MIGSFNVCSSIKLHLLLSPPHVLAFRLPPKMACARNKGKTVNKKLGNFSMGKNVQFCRFNEWKAI